MTPEERHALAERLDADAEWHTGECAQKHANYGGARGCCADANAAHDLRAAAAALREMPSTEEVVTAARASLWEQMESEAVERLTAEVARLRAGIEAHRRRVPTEQAAADRDLWALLDEGAPVDAVAIPRSAIPELVELGRRVNNCKPHDDLWCSCKVRQFLGLLSGATTGGDQG